MEIQKFSELESRINGLLGDYALLKKRNSELETELQNKIKELEETHRALEELQEDKDAVRMKVDSLLDMLQEIKAP